MDKSRTSVCTYPLIKRPLEDALKVIAAAGLKKVELLGRMPHFSLNPAECDPVKLKGVVEGHGLKVSALGTYVGAGFLSEDPKKQQDELDAVCGAIDAAAVLGARCIRVLRGKDCEAPQFVDRIVPWMKKAAERASRKNVRMGVENHGGALSGDIAKCSELFDKVGSQYFGLLYDPCNYFTYGGDYKAALKTFRGRIVHVHVKDAANKGGEKPVLTMLGEGEVDYAWVVRELAASGYTGDYSLEYELETEPPDTALKKWADRFAAV